MMIYWYLLLLLLPLRARLSEASPEESAMLQDAWEKDPQAVNIGQVNMMYNEDLYFFLEQMHRLRYFPQSTVDEDGRGRMKDIRPPTEEEARLILAGERPDAYWLQFYNRRDIVTYMVTTLHNDFGGPKGVSKALEEADDERVNSAFAAKANIEWFKEDEESSLKRKYMRYIDSLLDRLYSEAPDMDGFNRLLERLLHMRYDPQSTVDEDGKGELKDIRPRSEKEVQMSSDGERPGAYYLQFYHRRDIVEKMIMTLYDDFGGLEAFTEKLNAAGKSKEGDEQERKDVERELKRLRETDAGKFKIAILELLDLASATRGYWNKLFQKLDCDRMNVCLDELAKERDDHVLSFLLWKLLSGEYPVATPEHLDKIMHEVKSNRHLRKREDLRKELKQLAESDMNKFNLAILEFLQLVPNSKDRTHIWLMKLNFILDCKEVDPCLDKLASHDDGLFFLLWKLVTSRLSSKDEQPLTTPDQLYKILGEVKGDPNPRKAPIETAQHELVMQNWWEKDPERVAGITVREMYKDASTGNMEGFNNLLEKLLQLRHDPLSTVDEDGEGQMKDIRRETAEEARLHLGGQMPVAYFAQFYHRRDIVEYLVRTLHSDFGGPYEYMAKLDGVGKDRDNEKDREDLEQQLMKLAETDMDKFNLAVLEFLELAPNANDRRNRRDIWGKLAFILDCEDRDPCLAKLATHKDGLSFLLWRLLTKDGSSNNIPVTTPDQLYMILHKVKSNPDPLQSHLGAIGISKGKDPHFRWLKILLPLEMEHATAYTLDPKVIVRSVSYFVYVVLAIAAAVFLRDGFTKKQKKMAAAVAAKKSIQKARKESKKKKK